MELIILISSLLANGLTALIKPKDSSTFTPEEAHARKVALRFFNAFFGLVIVIGTAILTGQPLDPGELSGMIEIMVTIGITFATSQGMYLLRKA